jgi:hypothetical protein
MAEKLEWGLTDWAGSGSDWLPGQREIRIRNSRDDLRVATKSLTVNGVPLADVLERAAGQMADAWTHGRGVDETDAAVLRALAGTKLCEHGETYNADGSIDCLHCYAEG